MEVIIKIENYRQIPFFKTKTIEFNLPTSWAEASYKDIQLLYPLKALAEDEKVLEVILSHYVKPKYLQYINVVDKQKMINLLRKLYQSSITKLSFSSIKFTQKKISFWFLGKLKAIKTPFKNRLNIPNAYLSNLKFGEVAAGLKQIIIYFNTDGKNEDNLNKAMAIFFRPYKHFFFKKGNISIERETFDMDRINRQAKTFTNMPVAEKLFFIHYILDTLEALKTAPKLQVLFPKPPTKEQSQTEIKKEPSNKDPNIWFDFMISIAELNLAGDFNKISETSFVQVLTIAAKKKQDTINLQMKQAHQNGQK